MFLSNQDTALQLDASFDGWGEILEELSSKNTWFPQERLLHIDQLEFLAVYNIA